MTFDSILATFVYLFACFLLFVLGKWVFVLFHKSINIQDELVEKDNFAFAISHTGFFIGLLLAVGSVITGSSAGVVEDLIDIFTYGILAIVLLNISIVINDKLILPHFNVKKEIIEDQNVGTGVIEAANSIAIGLILFGAISGEGGSVFTGIAFWAVGQSILILATKIYDLITPYSVHEHIEKDNVAVGIGFAGALIAIGNIIGHAVSGDFLSWEDSAESLGIDLLIGFAFLPLIRFATDKLLLPGQNLTDELINQERPNNGAALIEAFAYIGGSVLIRWCL